MKTNQGRERRTLLPRRPGTTWFLACLCLIWATVAAHAQTNLLPASPVTSAWSYGTGTTATTVSVTGAPGFTQALHVTVNNTSANIWDSGFGWNTVAAANSGDNLRITFWVRKLSPIDGNNIRANVVFQQSSTPYTGSLRTVFPCDSSTWTKYVIDTKAAIAYPSGGGELTFQCGYGPQTFEIGGVQCVNLGPTTAPPTATDVIPANGSGRYNYGTGTTVTPITVTGQSFTSGYRIQTTADMDAVYSAGLGWNTTVPLTASDTCLLTFWARQAGTAGTPIRAQVVVEENGGAYEKSLIATFPVDDGTWRQYAIPCRITKNFAVGGAHLIFQYGYGPQTFEIGGIRLVDYGQNISADRLATAYYYPGRDSSASWRLEADSRIDSLRKANLTVTVKGSNGAVIPNAQVFVNQTGHTYKFGSAVVASKIMGTGQDNDIYRSRISSHFTTSVMENDLKWGPWETGNRTTTLNALTWLGNNNITIRGHNLIWPRFNYMPADTATLSATDLRTRINNHFYDELGNPDVLGKCYEWDVLNEPYTNYDVQGRIGGVTGVTPSTGILGNAEMVSWFNLAHQIDPNAKLFLNDYDILAAGGSDKKHQDYYYALAQYLLNNGAPLNALGFQGHFGGPTPIGTMQSIIDRFGNLGLRLAITEYDFNSLDEKLQADFTRDLMTLIFSNEKFDDFLMWGFWENSHWLPLAAMYRADWSSRPMALAYNDLLFQRWWTNASGATNTSGTYTVRAFKGTYNITATYNGVTSQATATLGANGAITLILNTVP